MADNKALPVDLKNTKEGGVGGVRKLVVQAAEKLVGKASVDARNILGGEGAEQAVPSKVITRSGTYNVKPVAKGKIELTDSNGTKATMSSPSQITPANMKNIGKVSNAMEKTGIKEMTSNNVKIAKGTQADHASYSVDRKTGRAN